MTRTRAGSSQARRLLWLAVPDDTVELSRVAHDDYAML